MSRARLGIGRSLLALGTLTLVVAALVGSTAPVPALGQTDPYATTTTTQAGGTTTTTQAGGTTTTTQAGGTTTTTGTCQPSIELSIQVGQSGIRVQVRALCFPVGVRVTFTFDGRPVGSAMTGAGTASALGGNTSGRLAAILPSAVLNQVRQVVGGGQVAQANAAGTAALDFTIPSSQPGVYPVCAFSDGVAPVCTTYRVVVASNGTRVTGLARTGLYLLPLVAIGIGAIATGRTLRRGSRRKRRA